VAVPQRKFAGNFKSPAIVADNLRQNQPDEQQNGLMLVRAISPCARTRLNPPSHLGIVLTHG
jgi:hypothetical protein